jgi:hypothetical protein
VSTRPLTVLPATGIAAQWCSRATAGCAPFLYPEFRFRNPWAGDDLAEAVAAARRWLEENPCPNDIVNEHVSMVLDAYAEMSTATVARVMALRMVIHDHVSGLNGANAFQKLPALAS